MTRLFHCPFSRSHNTLFVDDLPCFKEGPDDDGDDDDDRGGGDGGGDGAARRRKAVVVLSGGDSIVPAHAVRSGDTRRYAVARHGVAARARMDETPPRPRFWRAREL